MALICSFRCIQRCKLRRHFHCITADCMVERSGTDLPKYTPVLIVGAGPVGSTCSLLLSKLHIPHFLIDRYEEPSKLPQAHYISNRSMEIWRPVGHLDSLLQSYTPPINDWKQFVYCNSVFPTSKSIGVRNHLKDYHCYDNTYFEPSSPSKIAHLGQQHLVRLLRQRIEELAFSNTGGYNINMRSDQRKTEHETDRLKQRHAHMVPLDATLCSEQEKKWHNVYATVAYGVEWVAGSKQKHKRNDSFVVSTLKCKKTGALKECISNFVVATDGAHSNIRKFLRIAMTGVERLQSLVNICFQSKTFGKIARHNPAMLYFIFNSQVIAVLVGHNLDEGEFVAQMPYFPELEGDTLVHTTEYYESLISSMAGVVLEDIKIKDIRKWVMSAKVADTFVDETSNRIILAGDAAHVIPPAGGLGMNLGIADAMNLCWKIARAVDANCNSSNVPCSSKVPHWELLIQSYNTERLLVAKYSCQAAINNFNASLSIPNILGYNWTATRNVVEFIESIKNYPSSRSDFSWTHSAAVSYAAHHVSSALSKMFELAYSTAKKQLPGLIQLPIVWNAHEASVERLLKDPTSNLTLISPGIDLAYSYPPHALDSSPHRPLKGMKVSSSPFLYAPTELIGCRIPHFPLYAKIQKDVIDDANCVYKLSTVDIPFLCSPPLYYSVIVFSEFTLGNVKYFLDKIKAAAKQNEVGDVGITEKFFVTFWDTNNLNMSHSMSFVKINLKPFLLSEDILNTLGANQKGYRYVWSSRNAKENFFKTLSLLPHEDCLVVLRPDSHIYSIITVPDSSGNYPIQEKLAEMMTQLL